MFGPSAVGKRHLIETMSDDPGHPMHATMGTVPGDVYLLTVTPTQYAARTRARNGQPKPWQDYRRGLRRLQLALEHRNPITITNG